MDTHVHGGMFVHINICVCEGICVSSFSSPVPWGIFILLLVELVHCFE